MERENGKHLAGGTPRKNNPKKHRKPGRLTRGQKGLIALAVVLAVALAGVIAGSWLGCWLAGKSADIGRKSRRAEQTAHRLNAKGPSTFMERRRGRACDVSLHDTY